MNGKEFFTRMEAAFPGFLRRFYGAPPYSEARDREVADQLAPFAAAAGCQRLSGEMVGKARLTVGLATIKRVVLAIQPKPEAAAVPIPQEKLPLAAPSHDAADTLKRMFGGLHGKLDEVLGKVEKLGERVAQIEAGSQPGNLLTIVPSEGVQRAS